MRQPSRPPLGRTDRPDRRGNHASTCPSLLLLLALLGCGDAAKEQANAPSVVSPGPSAAASPPASSEPTPDAPVCRCGDGETCLDGACLALPADIAANTLRSAGRLGFWNAWSTIAPLARGATEKIHGAGLDLDPVGGPRAARATCARSGWVPGRDKRAGERWSVHAAWLVAARDVEVDLWGSTVGALEVRIGDAAPARFVEVVGGEGRAMIDESSARVVIPRGVVPVLVLHERPEERPGGFYLRLRDPAGGAPKGVRMVERVATARCESAELLDPHLEVVPSRKEGAPTFTLTLRPVFEGLVPAEAGDFALEAALGRADEARTRSAPLALTDVVAGEATATLEVPAPKKGEAAIAVHVAGSGKALAETRVRAFPKDLHVRVAALVEAVGEAPREKAPAARASLEHHANVLARAVAAAEKDTAWLEEHTRRAEQLLEGLTRGEDPYPAARGTVFRAYRSPIDEQLQPYVTFVPKSADKGRPMPVVIVAHGMDRLPEHALRTLVGQAPDEHMTLDWAAKHLPRFPDQGAILVAPWQFGNAGPHALGDADLAAVIEDVASTWSVDRRRISLTGYSLGGTVSFVAPLHAPDRFSASAPLCGYPNLMDYKNVRGVEKKAWEPTLLAREYVVGMAENGLHLPLHVVHGGKDVPGRSKVVVDRWRELGQSVVWDLQEDADHNVWDDAYEDGRMVSWLTRHRRPAAPRRVRLVTGEYRVDRSDWLRIVGLDDAGGRALASIDATFDPAAKKLVATTRGVESFVVDRERLPDASGEPADPGAITLAVDGRDLGEVPAGEPIGVARGDDGNLARVATVPSRAGKKRHGVSGPLEDALHHPLLVVRGTTAPALVEANRLVAEHLATASGTAALRIPIVTDVAATEDLLRGKSVVLIGGPASNRLTRSWEAQLPARFEGSAIVLRGQRYEGPDQAVSLIAPRPGDPDRYVVLHAGTSARGTLAARHLPRYLPDWVVYDAKIAAQRGGLLFGERPTLAGGFFDESWR